MAVIATGWVPIVGGSPATADTGAEATGKITTAFSNTNTFMTETLATAANHETRVAALEAQSFYTYDYTTVNDITVTNDVYEQVASLIIADRVAGTYRFEATMLYSLNSVTNSSFFRFSLDNGATWVEIRRETKDITDVIPVAYATTVVHTGGAVNIVVQARKEVASDVLTIPTIDLMFNRKL